MSARLYTNMDIPISRRIVRLLNETFKENLKKKVRETVNYRMKAWHQEALNEDLMTCKSSHLLCFKHASLSQGGL